MAEAMRGKKRDLDVMKKVVIINIKMCMTSDRSPVTSVYRNSCETFRSNLGVYDHDQSYEFINFHYFFMWQNMIIVTQLPTQVASRVTPQDYCKNGC